MPLAALLPHTQKQCEYKQNKTWVLCSELYASCRVQTALYPGWSWVLWPENTRRRQQVQSSFLSVKPFCTVFGTTSASRLLGYFFYGPNSPSCESYLLSMLQEHIDKIVRTLLDPPSALSIGTRGTAQWCKWMSRFTRIARMQLDVAGVIVFSNDVSLSGHFINSAKDYLLFLQWKGTNCCTDWHQQCLSIIWKTMVSFNVSEFQGRWEVSLMKFDVHKQSESACRDQAEANAHFQQNMCQ